MSCWLWLLWLGRAPGPTPPLQGVLRAAHSALAGRRRTLRPRPRIAAQRAREERWKFGGRGWSGPVGQLAGEVSGPAASLALIADACPVQTLAAGGSAGGLHGIAMIDQYSLFPFRGMPIT